MLTREAIDIFLMYKRSEGLSPRTVEWYAAQLAQFCQWLGPCRIEEIRPLDVVNFIVSRQERALSSITVEGAYRALLAFFNWCEGSTDAGRVPSPIGHGPHKIVKRPRTDEPDMDFATFEEYMALTTAIDLASWLDYRDWCMIGIMFWCGVRRGELLSMGLRDLDFDKSEIHIRHSKARKQRVIFLLDDLQAGLRQYLAMRPAWEGQELWLAYDKARRGIAGALSTTGLRLMLVRRCKRAGIRFLHPHLFRHGFAMTYLNHGVDLKAVGDLLGHSSYKTTERHYAKWMDGPLRNLHRRTAEEIVGKGSG